jgi:DNA-directed RNA polymerase subunit K
MLKKQLADPMEYTKFEKARIIGARALQLAYGAPPLIKVPEGVTDPLALAELEFQEDVIPIVVVRGRVQK